MNGKQVICRSLNMLRHYSSIYIDRVVENTTNLRLDSRKFCRDWTRILPEYKFRATLQSIPKTSKLGILELTT
jgi:hypothetical protein